MSVTGLQAAQLAVVRLLEAWLVVAGRTAVKPRLWWSVLKSAGERLSCTRSRVPCLAARVRARCLSQWSHIQCGSQSHPIRDREDVPCSDGHDGAQAHCLSGIPLVLVTSGQASWAVSRSPASAPRSSIRASRR
jgi:hypothetical protein